MSQTIKTKGIVLRQLKFRETSVILDVFTEPGGLKSYLIHGVRSAKPAVSPMLLQPGSAIDLVAYDGQQTRLKKVKEVKASVVFSSLRFSVPKSALSQFVIEVSRHISKEDELRFMISEHTKDFNRVTDVVRYEGEHLVLFHNDRKRYDETADHSKGGSHPILQ